MIKEASDTTESISPVILKAVQESASAFFTNVCGVLPVKNDSTEKNGKYSGIMGVISFFGGNPWSFALVLPHETAVAVVTKFFGFEMPYESSDMGDAIGEIANVIAGDIVARLESQNITTQMSLPTVARGDDVELIPPSDAKVAQMGFYVPEGNFWFKLVSARRSIGAVRRSGA